MQKEALTLKNIAEDLKIVSGENMYHKEEAHFTYIVPFTVLAVFLGILLQNIWIGFLVFLPAVYFIVRYVMERARHKAEKQALMDVINRGDISISVEKFSHTAFETVYEPHTHGIGFGRGAHANATKEIFVFYFMSGARWRVPSVNKHYEWSKDYYVSTKGLENISLQGDEFFFVRLQGYHDIAYIYPCKSFVLDKNLKN